MPKNQPWAIPPRPTTYDKDPDALYAAVGAALSMWQYVDDAIARIFELIVTDCRPRYPFINSMSPAERAYGSVVSFDSRASMVEAAADAFFFVHEHAHLQLQLRELMTACRGWSARRNEVAHGRIGGAPTDLSYCVLWPTESSTRKNAVDHRAVFVYNSAQIRQFDTHFSDLHGQILDFSSAFRVWRVGPLEEFAPLEQQLQSGQMEDRTDLQ